MRLLIDETDLNVSVRHQCELMGVNRSSYYYEPKGENSENLQIMHLMDKYIQDEPTAGVLTMQSMLWDEKINAGYERVRRLMRKGNIKAIYPRRSLTIRKSTEYLYPYLLRNMDITAVGQVWEIDITYIPMARGFMYLTAIIDVYSRYIVAWNISNSLDASESLRVVKEAIAVHGAPDILNSDQGSQFTCKEYVDCLKSEGIRISMDGKGRALDNIYIERFWRRIKYDYIYLNPADNGLQLYQGIKQWLSRYHNRAHQGIDRKKPNDVFKQVA